MNPLNKSSLKCLLYVLLLLAVIVGGIYTIAIIGELITVSLGMGAILGLLFILINKESQRIEKYLYEEEQKIHESNGGQYLFTSKPKRYVEGDSNYWINLNCPNEDEFAGNFNYTQISEEDRIQLNIPMISWKNEPIKIELDIQAMVINQ